MVSQKYRWDFIGLSTDTKPTSETSDKVVNGSTYYCSDTSKLYVYCDGTWYERKPLGGGGTSDFNDLSNRPKYNGSDMTGSTNIPEVVTYSDFTGTDGTAAGTAGLVPAPATTDAGKFLGASGLWEAVQAGGVTELTSADYDYPTDNPNRVLLGMLPAGIYYRSNSVNVGVRTELLNDNQNFFIIMRSSGSTRVYVNILGPSGSANGGIYQDLQVWAVSGTNGSLLEKSGALSTENLAQATGTSTTNVMSQNAVTSMVFADPSTARQVKIGDNAASSQNESIAIGRNALSDQPKGIAIGGGSNGLDAARAKARGSIALGAGAYADTQGVMNIGSNYNTNYGYNNSNYRLLTGLYDGQSAHDAATLAQGNTLSTSAPTTSTVGVLGQLYTDTTNMHTYQCTAISGDTYTWTQRW